MKLTKETYQNRKNFEYYFHQDINQRKLCCKKLSKFVAAFEYIKNGEVSIISLTNVVGAPAGIANASFTLIFSLTTGIIKKLISITRNKKKKLHKILMLAKSKFSSFETLVSQALIDMKISNEEFNATERIKERIKGNVRNVSDN